MKSLALLLFAILLSPASAEPPKMDKFTSKDGRSIKALFIDYDERGIKVRRLDVTDIKGDPMTLHIPYEMLSAATMEMVNKKIDAAKKMESRIQKLVAKFPPNKLEDPIYFGRIRTHKRDSADAAIYRRYMGYIAKMKALGMRQLIEFIEDMLQSDIAANYEQSPFKSGVSAQRQANAMWLSKEFTPYLQSFKRLKAE